MRSLRAALIDGWSLSARDTLDTETPKRWAMSYMDVRFFTISGVSCAAVYAIVCANVKINPVDANVFLLGSFFDVV